MIAYTHKFVQPVNRAINAVGLLLFFVCGFPPGTLSAFLDSVFIHSNANAPLVSRMCACVRVCVSVCHGMMFPATIFLEA